MLSTQTLLALSHPVVVVLVGGAILLTWYYEPSRPRYLVSFGLSYLAYSSGVTLQSANIPSGLVANVLICGLLFIGATVLLTHGLVSLAERHYPLWLPLLVIAVMLASRAYYVAIDDNALVRLYTLHSAMLAVMLHGAWRARSVLGGRSAEKTVFWSFLALALSNIPRAAVVTTWSGSTYAPDLELYWALTQVCIYVFSIVFGLALILTIMNRRVVVHRTLSETDPLTGLRNRRGFHDLVERRLSRVNNYSVLIGDIDHFKCINDAYGHSAGDAVLARIAEIIEASLRPGDISGRIGGEEFAIFLPDTSLHDAHSVAERLRSNIERTTFSAGDCTLKCTISLGIAFCDSTTTLNDALWQSDKRLYQAKAQGRNRVAGAAVTESSYPACKSFHTL